MRARVRNFQAAGFVVSFEVAQDEVPKAVATITAIRERPDLAGWRIAAHGGAWLSFYFEPGRAVPEDIKLRSGRKAGAKEALRAAGFEVVSESTPIAGQVR